MTFDLAVNIVLMHEGGAIISNDPRDAGGETKYGISKRAFPNEDIKLLTLDRAKDLYRNYYWNMCECESLPFYARLMVFDCAVNQGVTRATIFLQKILKVKQDSIIGPETIKAVAGMDKAEFIEGYSKMRANSYMNNPQWHVFGKGWMVRLLDITYKSYAQIIPTDRLLVS